MLILTPAILPLTILQLQVIVGLFILGERMDGKECGAIHPSWHSPALSISINQALFLRDTVLGSKV